MNANEIEEEVQSRLNQLIDDLVRKRLADMSPEELANRVADSPEMRRAFSDWLDKTLPTVIGNRLRCGCWEGGHMDRIFESVWTDQFQKSMESRVRMKALDTASTIAEKFLTKALEGIKQAERITNFETRG